jgi:lipoyl(octanoyl) transferase
VKQGRTYHGLALNVDMDLTPFSAINPCGYVGLAVTDCRRQGIAIDQDQVGRELVECLCEHLNCLVPGPLT